MRIHKIPISWLQAEEVPRPTLKGAQSGAMEDLRKAILGLTPGSDQSIVWGGPQTLVYRAAQQVGAKVRTLKVDQQGYSVWRL